MTTKKQDFASIAIWIAEQSKDIETTKNLVFYGINEDKKEVIVMAVFNERMDYMRVMRKFI